MTLLDIKMVVLTFDRLEHLYSMMLFFWFFYCYHREETQESEEKERHVHVIRTYLIWQEGVRAKINPHHTRPATPLFLVTHNY